MAQEFWQYNDGRDNEDPRDQWNRANWGGTAFSLPHAWLLLWRASLWAALPLTLATGIPRLWRERNVQRRKFRRAWPFAVVRSPPGRMALPLSQRVQVSVRARCRQRSIAVLGRAATHAAQYPETVGERVAGNFGINPVALLARPAAWLRQRLHQRDAKRPDVARPRHWDETNSGAHRNPRPARNAIPQRVTESIEKFDLIADRVHIRGLRRPMREALSMQVEQKPLRREPPSRGFLPRQRSLWQDCERFSPRIRPRHRGGPVRPVRNPGVQELQQIGVKKASRRAPIGRDATLPCPDAQEIT